VSGYDLQRIRAALAGRRVDYYDTIDSTMTAAAALEPGAVVFANSQSAGQGRHGHSWHSESGAGLYVTLVLRPRLTPDTLPVVTLALGLAAQEAIAQVCGVAADLRWPNDLLVGARKCGGILTQLQGDRVLAGIGINVNHSGFPAELTMLATSLRLATDREHSRGELLCALVKGVDRIIGLLETNGIRPILELFTLQSSYALGRRVRVDLPAGEVTGVTAGLTSDGYLLLDGDDGRRHTIVAGGVRPAE